MATFLNKLKVLMAEYELGIQSTEGLTGAKLQEMQENNAGMEQIYDAIDKLHKEFLAAAPKKRATATKTKKDDDDEATTEGSSDEKPKKKRAPAKKKEAGAAADGESKPKAKSAYSEFAPHITKGNKGEVDGWDSIMVYVSFSKLTDTSAALLEKSKALSDLKALSSQGTQHSMATLLKACKDALMEAEGKVVIGKLSGVMWSAVGNVNPF